MAKRPSRCCYPVTDIVSPSEGQCINYLPASSNCSSLQHRSLRQWIDSKSFPLECCMALSILFKFLAQQSWTLGNPPCRAKLDTCVFIGAHPWLHRLIKTWKILIQNKRTKIKGIFTSCSWLYAKSALMTTSRTVIFCCPQQQGSRDGSEVASVYHGSFALC